jgi:crotonobetainyl-CoA:carnitine CoA-transferase CaiB-like acyl-CoA transferase
MLDVSMTDGVISWLAHHFGVFFATGEIPLRGEERLNGGWICYGVYETKEGNYLTLGALEPKFWQNLCHLLGREDLVPHQYATGVKRDEVVADLRAIFKTKTREEWLALFKGKDVCVGPVLDFSEVPADPHVKHRGLFQTIAQPASGSIPQVTFPVQLSETPAAISRPAPELGEHTESLLSSLDYSAEEISGFRARGVI